MDIDKLKEEEWIPKEGDWIVSLNDHPWRDKDEVFQALRGTASRVIYYKPKKEQTSKSSNKKNWRKALPHEIPSEGRSSSEIVLEKGKWYTSPEYCHGRQDIFQFDYEKENDVYFTATIRNGVYNDTKGYWVKVEKLEEVPLEKISKYLPKTSETMENKFKKGDVVIGINSNYFITGEGWIGKVINVYGNEKIAVKGRRPDGRIDSFIVKSEYFELHTPSIQEVISEGDSSSQKKDYFVPKTIIHKGKEVTAVGRNGDNIVILRDEPRLGWYITQTRLDTYNIHPKYLGRDAWVIFAGKTTSEVQMGMDVIDSCKSEVSKQKTITIPLIEVKRRFS